MPRDPFQSEESIEFTGDNIGDFLLNVLTVGLYNRPDLIIREYIQNSHDAICFWPGRMEPGRVDIRVDWPNVHIFDNGPGMDREELLQAMSNLGKSTKTISVGSGFMGIGKLAGISMASRVEIHSSKVGIPEKNWVAFESSEMLAGIMERRLQGVHHSILETLYAHTKANEVPLQDDAETHYTSVHLLNIHEDYRNKVENIDEFIRSLGLIVPVIQNPKFDHAPVIEKKFKRLIPNDYMPIDIFVNGKPVYRPYVKGLGEPEDIMVLDDNDNIIGYGWACLNTASERYKREISDDDLRGIALMQRGISIGNRNLPEEMGLYPSTGNLIYFRWYCGELYIVDPKVIVSADRTRIRQNNDTFKFTQKASNEFRRLAKIAKTWADQDNANTVIQESAQKVAEIEAQVTSKPLTDDHIPRLLSELGKAQSDVEKKKKFPTSEETKKQVNFVEKTVNIILDQIVAAQSNKGLSSSIKTVQEQENMLPISNFVEEKTLDTSEILEDAQEKDLFDESVSEASRYLVLYNIPEKLGFSPRETRIYRTIMQAIADACEGRNSERFTKIADAIEAALEVAFSSDIEVL